MKKLLVVQHVAHEILGTLNPLLKRAGFRIRYVNFARYPEAEPSLDGYDGLIILGGPMSVYDADRFVHLTTELKLIEHAMERELPILGICLGAQLIAKALGASVYPNEEKEIGWYDVSPRDEAEGAKRLEGRKRFSSGMGIRLTSPEALSTSPHRLFAAARHFVTVSMSMAFSSTWKWMRP